MSPSERASAVQYRLRPATPEDFGFAEKLYLETSKSLSMELGTWDEATAVRRFKDLFELGSLWVIRVDGVDAGWLQRSETEAEVRLDEIHLTKDYRSAGIGSQFMRDFLAEARDGHKPVSLSVFTNNPARALYLRFGFKVVSQSNQRFHMRWDPPGIEPRDDKPVPC